MWLAKSMFCYGCVTTLAALAAFATAILGWNLFPNHLWIVEALVLIHGCAFLVTFDRDARRKPRLPLFQLTVRRVLAAKVVLGAAVSNILIWGSLFFVYASKGDRNNAEWLLPIVVTGLVLLSTLYIALHWALRPETFLPRPIVNLFANPIGVLFFRKVRDPDERRHS